MKAGCRALLAKLASAKRKAFSKRHSEVVEPWLLSRAMTPSHPLGDGSKGKIPLPSSLGGQRESPARECAHLRAAEELHTFEPQGFQDRYGCFSLKMDFKALNDFHPTSSTLTSATSPINGAPPTCSRKIWQISLRRQPFD